MPRQQVVDFKYATPAVDVWAVRPSLYFAVTGSTPRVFRPGGDPWRAVWQTRPVPVRERGVAVPAARWPTSWNEAPADDAELRFATIAELRTALEAQ
jgi:hypothetical protein